MKRFRDVVDLLEYEELMNIKKDLNKGGDGIRILIENKIKNEIKKKNQFCAICASKIDAESKTKFTLTFGPEELEKQATFCAIDCLEYFLSKMKKVIG